MADAVRRGAGRGRGFKVGNGRRALPVPPPPRSPAPPPLSGNPFSRSRSPLSSERMELSCSVGGSTAAPPGPGPPGPIAAPSVPPPMEGEDYESLPSGASLGTHMLAGAVAGIMEHSVMYPVDSVKVRGLGRAWGVTWDCALFDAGGCAWGMGCTGGVWVGEGGGIVVQGLLMGYRVVKVGSCEGYGRAKGVCVWGKGVQRGLVCGELGCRVCLWGTLWVWGVLGQLRAGRVRGKSCIGSEGLHSWNAWSGCA